MRSSREITTPSQAQGTHISNDKVSLNASSFQEYVQFLLKERRLAEGQETFHHEVVVLNDTPNQWMEGIKREFADFLIMQHDSNAGVIIKDNNFLLFETNNRTITFDIYGDNDFLYFVEGIINKSFTLVVSHIRWVYNKHGDYVEIPLTTTHLPTEEMYPFLDSNLLSYYEDFMKSFSNILLLIGPPGTGKTSFIRGLLAHTKTSATVTYDAAILNDDYLFASFIGGNNSIMVLEDADAFLSSRSSGNEMMQRFLNVGDGLVTSSNKKLIFSTNLPSVRDIDPALTRPGRCYDILHFRELTFNEANILANNHKIELKTHKEKWTLADIFNQKPLHYSKSVGFT